MIPEAQRATFQGIVRPDGRVGTRNFIAVVSSVNCSATVSHAVAEGGEEAERKLAEASAAIARLVRS